MKNFVKVGLLGFFLLVGAGLFAQKFKGANFGSYPADYPLKYATEVGLSETVSPRSLYGPDAQFATSIDGLPVVTTLESSKGTKDKFSATLLVSRQDKVKILRFEVTFEPDNAEKVCIPRYIKIANLIDKGKGFELKSKKGGEKGDAKAIFEFSEVAKMFWDFSHYKSTTPNKKKR